jgi:hypothetical protein
MKAKLSVLERLTLQNLLPEKGTFLNLKLVRKAKEALSFSDAEHKKYGLVTLPNGAIQWSNDSFKAIDIGDEATAMVIKALKELDEKAELEDRHISLFEKYIPTK